MKLKNRWLALGVSLIGLGVMVLVILLALNIGFGPEADPYQGIASLPAWFWIFLGVITLVNTEIGYYWAISEELGDSWVWCKIHGFIVGGLGTLICVFMSGMVFMAIGNVILIILKHPKEVGLGTIWVLGITGLIGLLFYMNYKLYKRWTRCKK